MPEAAPITTLPTLPERVFVSYTHDSPAHCALVRRMVLRLREKGFTVVFDEDQPAGGPDLGWATWSENEAANAPRVIVVATEAFGKCWCGQHPAPAARSYPPFSRPSGAEVIPGQSGGSASLHARLI